MKTIIFNVLLLSSLFLVQVISFAGDIQQCQLCGMDLNNYKHVRYTVNTVDKKQITTCGVQCGLLIQLNLAEKFDSATATTLLENRTISAKDAWYVYRSSVVTDMAPGFIAFLSAEQARQFVAGFGGSVVTSQQAMEIVTNGFK